MKKMYNILLCIALFVIALSSTALACAPCTHPTSTLYVTSGQVVKLNAPLPTAPSIWTYAWSADYISPGTPPYVIDQQTGDSGAGGEAFEFTVPALMAGVNELAVWLTVADKSLDTCKVTTCIKLIAVKLPDCNSYTKIKCIDKWSSPSDDTFTYGPTTYSGLVYEWTFDGTPVGTNSNTVTIANWGTDGVAHQIVLNVYVSPKTDFPTAIKTCTWTVTRVPVPIAPITLAP